MSGGSYDYASLTDCLDDLVRHQQQLERLAERLAMLPEAEFPGAAAAAQGTLALLVRAGLWDAHVRATSAVLRPVWHAVEWWDSNDWGPDQVREALAEAVNGAPS